MRYGKKSHLIISPLIFEIQWKKYEKLGGEMMIFIGGEEWLIKGSSVTLMNGWEQIYLKSNYLFEMNKGINKSMKLLP